MSEAQQADDVRGRIERVLDFPTSFDAPTFAEWKRTMADAVVNALGLRVVCCHCHSNPCRSIEPTAHRAEFSCYRLSSRGTEA